jgi:hypothetical protein
LVVRFFQLFNLIAEPIGAIYAGPGNLLSIAVSGSAVKSVPRFRATIILSIPLRLPDLNR